MHSVTLLRGPALLHPHRPSRSILALVLLATLTIAPRLASAQTPFGLRMGLTVAELKRLTGATPDSARQGSYHSTRVPNPNADFEAYGFLVSPTTGLCKLWATGVTVENDGYGSALHSKFDGFQAALDQKYGEHKNYDFLRDGSIWNEPKEWMMGLYKQERILTSFWGDSTSTIRVRLKASALGSSSGWLTLDYEFANSSRCIDDLQRLNNSSL